MLTVRQKIVRIDGEETRSSLQGMRVDPRLPQRIEHRVYSDWPLRLLIDHAIPLVFALMIKTN